MKRNIIRYGMLIILLAGTYIYFQMINIRFREVDTFEACVRAGYPVSSTYPETCILPGKKFVNTTQVQTVTTTDIPTSTTTIQVDHLNSTYTIDGEPIQLTDGIFEIKASPDDSSSSLSSFKALDIQEEFDFNDDGTKDVAFILVANTGGSGTFYYLVVAFKQKDAYIGSNAIFLGDRIIPTAIDGAKNSILVTYKDRKPSDSMVSEPTVITKKYILVKNNMLK